MSTVDPDGVSLTLQLTATILRITSVCILPGAAIFFEFKHYKPKKKFTSTKCFAFMEMDEIKPGPIVVELWVDGLVFGFRFSSFQIICRGLIQHLSAWTPGTRSPQTSRGRNCNCWQRSSCTSTSIRRYTRTAKSTPPRTLETLSLPSSSTQQRSRPLSAGECRRRIQPSYSPVPAIVGLPQLPEAGALNALR